MKLETHNPIVSLFSGFISLSQIYFTEANMAKNYYSLTKIILRKIYTLPSQCFMKKVLGTIGKMISLSNYRSFCQSDGRIKF